MFEKKKLTFCEYCAHSKKDHKYGRCTYVIDEIKEFQVSVPGGVTGGASVFELCACRSFKELDKTRLRDTVDNRTQN